MSTYAFVDGSSLLSLIESARSYFSMDEGAIFDFGRFFQWEADAAARTFFYNAYPDQKPGTDEASHQVLLEKSQNPKYS